MSRQWVIVRPLHNAVQIQDAIEKVAWRVDAETVRFPNGVVDHMGKLVDTLPIPEGGEYRQLCTFDVRLLAKQYDKGPTEGTRLVALDDIFEATSTVLTRVHEYMEREAPKMLEDIEANGMRHPPVLDRKCSLIWGQCRFYAHHLAGHKHIEVYICDVTRKDFAVWYRHRMRGQQ